MLAHKEGLEEKGAEVQYGVYKKPGSDQSTLLSVAETTRLTHADVGDEEGDEGGGEEGDEDGGVRGRRRERAKKGEDEEGRIRKDGSTPAEQIDSNSAVRRLPIPRTLPAPPSHRAKW